MTEKHGDVIAALSTKRNCFPKVIGVTLCEFWTLGLKGPSCSWEDCPNGAMPLRILGWKAEWGPGSLTPAMSVDSCPCHPASSTQPHEPKQVKQKKHPINPQNHKNQWIAVGLSPWIGSEFFEAAIDNSLIISPMALTSPFPLYLNSNLSYLQPRKCSFYSWTLCWISS